MNWQFRYGVTTWYGPYSTCEEACSAAILINTLTPEQEAEVMAALLADRAYDSGGKTCVGLSMTRSPSHGSLWYIRLYDKSRFR